MAAERDDSPVPDNMKGLRLDGKGVVIFGVGQGSGRQATGTPLPAGPTAY